MSLPSMLNLVKLWSSRTGRRPQDMPDGTKVGPSGPFQQVNHVLPFRHDVQDSFDPNVGLHTEDMVPGCLSFDFALPLDMLSLLGSLQDWEVASGALHFFHELSCKLSCSCPLLQSLLLATGHLQGVLLSLMIVDSLVQQCWRGILGQNSASSSTSK